MIDRAEEKDLSYKEALGFIEQADELQLIDIINAVVRRYSCISSEDEVIFLFLSKEKRQRCQDIKGIVRGLRTKMKTDSLG